MTKQQKIEPIAVLISDVHYSLNTLEIADKAYRMAIDKAASLQVPLIDGGDLTNDKALLRGEVINRLIQTMQYALTNHVDIHLLVGNHSRLNEKAMPHALEFLRPYASVYEDFGYCDLKSTTVELIAYQPNDRFKDLCRPDGSNIVICHQGFQGAQMGDYVVDSSSVSPELFQRRIISGHYHRRQTLGSIDYIGNPYTLSFGEANDPPKGFQVLYSDGSLEFIPTNLRKHVVVDAVAKSPEFLEVTIDGVEIRAEDIVLVRLRGSQHHLDQLDKETIKNVLRLPGDFRLDLIPTEECTVVTQDAPHKTSAELLDELIDNSSQENKDYIKQLWRNL